MAAKGDKPSPNKGNPVTVMVSPASGSQTPSVRLASTVGSGKVPPLLQTVETVPGTVLIGLPQAKTSSSGGKKSVGTKTSKEATAQRPPGTPTNTNTLPSKYKVTAPRRMETRSRGKSVEKESSKSRKRKLPAKSSRPASEKSPKKSKVSPDTKVKKKSVSGSKTVSPQKSISKEKGVDTDQVIPKATVHPRTSASAMKMESGSNTFDVKVKLTPSQTVPRRKADKHGDDQSYSDTCNTKEVKELKAKAQKDAKMVEKLIKDRRMLRMRVFRANKKNEKLMKSIQLEQKMHKETRQTLKAIMQGLQLQLKTV